MLKVWSGNNIFQTRAIQLSGITFQTSLSDKSAELVVDVSHRRRAACPKEDRSGIENIEYCVGW